MKPKKIVVFLIYLVSIVAAFFFAPPLLFLLGLPWSVAVVMLGWLIIHAGSGNTLDWAMLLCTVPNIVLILRIILLEHIRRCIEVD